MSTFQSSPSPLFTRLVYVAFGLMAVVLMLSAYLRLSGAGFGCADWPACYGQGYADPWRELVVQSNGAIAIPFDAAAIHVTHRATAVAVDFYLLWLGLTAVGSGASRYGKALVGLVFLQALLGVTAVKFAHPLAVVLAHNALAAVLLLTLLSLAYRPHDHA